MKLLKMNMKPLSLIGLVMIFSISCGGLNPNKTDEGEEGLKEEEKHNMHEEKEHGHDHEHGDMDHDHESMKGEMMEKNGIKVYAAKIAKEFPDAKLTMATPQDPKAVKAGTNKFSFKVENYELATQTEGAEERNCANSEKGQHIHFILNNGPYQAHYEPTFEAELTEGQNVVLAFLSRSYHESIKNGSAYVLKSYTVGNAENKFNHNDRHLFYSRPKGTYSLTEGDKILLDFYLINTKLGMGEKVRATIDGEQFMLDKWQPYFVEGLKPGEHTFRLELIGEDGKLIPGPFNDSGDRKITVEA
jgi:hypothetical protein